MLKALACSLALVALAPPAEAQTWAEAAAPWAAADMPATGAPAAIGGYAGGCLAGGQPMPAEGPGFQVIRPSRNRYYGHPELVRMLEELGARAWAAGLGHMLVADMGQPRGGPMPNGHRSHQVGLDADIWLRLDLPLLPPEQRDDVDAVLMVDRAAFQVDRSVWGRPQEELIRLAALDPRVERIFVHPAIKMALCEASFPDRAWLQRVRPWWGHDAHFHVRLRCPADSPNCRPQDPVPAGEGCGQELMSWIPQPGAPPAPEPPPPRPPVLPAACQAVLSAGP